MDTDKSNSEEPVFTFDSSQYIRIPTRRIGAVIGVKGSNRKEIEKVTQSKIIIDSDTGEVEIRPDETLKDPVMLLKASEIVKAVGRGFYYKTALKLAKDNYFLEVIRLKAILGKKVKQITRVKSRIIGTEGKTRKQIELLTSTDMVISGSSISLIGTYAQNLVASEAIIRIINGGQIESVIKYLEEKKKEAKAKELEGVDEVDEDTPDVFADFEEEE